MPSHRLFITTNEAGAAAALDILGTAFEEAGHAVATTEIDEDAGTWEASVYIEDGEPAEMADIIAGHLAEILPGLEVRIEELPEIDWVSHSLEGLKPVRAGRFLVHGSHDRDAVRIGDIGILIDAAQAFGTGHHGTTAGCLEMLDSVIRGWPAAGRYPSPILDLGTGSGVLAIAAAKLTPAAILATDIDPVATRVALENMKINGVGNQVRAITAAGFHSPEIARAAPYELIVANILARPLMKMAPAIRHALAPGGSVILSGILATQRWKVLSAFNDQGMAHIRTLWRNGWVTIHLR
jgi:ribosomal protein L11 methyltransferase